ncbi:MAG: hypothetical protein B6I30_04310 [Desulfobacteraceae bacterium 4572_187]|nr:MAG: hypothetical protein B6I30_04310 [Desulfobacteraceae bacterium 4572_187]
MGPFSKNRSFPRKQTLANIFSRAVNKVLFVEDVVLSDYPHFAPHIEAIVALSNAYRKQKAENIFFDYDDLLIYLEMLLKNHSDVRDNICSVYHYIMVDEYQDTNKIQAEIIYLLAGIKQILVQKIKEIHRNGIPLNQIAVLFRASFHSFDLEIELSRDGIPFIKVGGFKFTESAHIKDVLTHLRVLSNPLDRISWYRILLLLDNIGPKTAMDIYETILAEKAGYTGIFAVQLKSRRSKGMVRLKDLFSTIDSKPMSVSQMGEAIVNYYVPILKEKYDDHPKRTRDLEGRFPSIHALHRKKELEEELRLMYVASTRAKKNLFFTYPVQVYDRSSGMILNRPSRLIDDIPDDILAKY